MTFEKGQRPPKHKEGCQCFRCAHTPWNKGKRGLKPNLSDETREDKRQQMIKRNLENNPMENPKTIKKVTQNLIDGYKTGRVKPWNKDKKGYTNSGSFKKGHKGYNGNWQGGKSFEPYGPEFNKQLKEQIRIRDNFRCQECFRHQNELFTKTGKPYKLLVHHIDFDKKNNIPKNLISLCRNCHVQTNYNRDDWTEYFKNKVINL